MCIEQGELDGLMMQNPHLMHSRQQRHFTTQPHSHSSGIQLPQPMQQSHYHRQEQHSHPSQQQHSSSGTSDLQSEYHSTINILSLRSVGRYKYYLSLDAKNELVHTK